MKGGPEIAFAHHLPDRRDLRLFLDFQHAGAVHTAEFTVKVGADGTAIVPPSACRRPRPATNRLPGTRPTPHGH